MSGIGSGLAALNIGARLLGVRKAATGIIARIPKPVWEAIAVIGYVVALIALHQHYAHAKIDRAVKAAIVQRDADWQKRLDQAHAQALAWKARADAQAKTISDQQRKLNDEANRRISADAGNLLVRGPGKAAAASCGPVGDSRPGAAAGRPQSGVGAADDARTLLPGDNGPADRAVVPWGWLVGRAKECDLDRAENIAWRAQREQLAKLRQQLLATAPRR